MRNLVMVLVVLGCLPNSSGRNCKPKETFTKVVPTNLEKQNYKQTYIKIHWCLYPCEPNKTEHLYAHVSHHVNSSIKSFEIDEHKTCRNSRNSSSNMNETEVQDKMREKYIRVKNIPSGIQAVPGIRCKNGPHVFQQWLGNKTLDIVSPWAQVMRCIDDGECEATKKTQRLFQRNQHVKEATVYIPAYNHTESCKKS